MRDYTKIEAWKLADDLAVEVYRATHSFPREEIYGITSQLRRAACSVPANMVEGSSRGSQKDYLHFLYIARGSLSETQYFIHLSRRLEYLPGADAQQMISPDKADFCLPARIDNGGGERIWKICQSCCRIDKPARHRFSSLVEQPVVRSP
jgi:four helix bundle protein